MPPKRSDTIHVTFHFYRSAVLLSVPSSTTLQSLKSQLLPALKPLGSTIPRPPTSTADYRLWDDKELVEGADAEQKELKCLDDEEGGMKKSLQAMGWPRWKTLYVSFKGEDGGFGKPEYTIPDPEDGDGEEAAGEGAA